MDSRLESSFERLWRWLKQHPLTAATAALVLVAALASPSSRNTQPPVDMGSDEPPLFI